MMRPVARLREGLRAARSRRKARWESHCTRCGQCCYEKERRGRSVVTNYRRPCEHLDVSTGLCTVYEERFAACAQCRRMTLLHALFVTWLPSSCGYVRRYRQYLNALSPMNSRRIDVAGTHRG